MHFYINALGVPEIPFLFFVCIEMSGFRYHHLSAYLYVLAISVVTVDNDLGNKRNLYSGAAMIF
jgi:hypothetical protein